MTREERGCGYELRVTEILRARITFKRKIKMSEKEGQRILERENNRGRNKGK